MREPMPKDRYQDKRGQFVTIKSCVFNRVIFYRDGYESPCEVPTSRFLKEFTHVETQTFTEWCEVSNPLEKIRKLRELINSRREVSE